MSTSGTSELECQNIWTDYLVVNYQFELDSYNVYSNKIMQWIFVHIIKAFYDFETDTET